MRTVQRCGNYVDFNLIDDPPKNGIRRHRNIIRCATYERKRMASWKLWKARFARRLLVQPPQVPALRVPQQEHHRRPQLRRRFPRCPDTHTL